MVDEGPDVGTEELLRLIFFHVLELQLRELLQPSEAVMKRNADIRKIIP